MACSRRPAREDAHVSPALPQRKLDAIERLETGLSNKFYFRFSECFWDTDKDLVNLVDPNGDGA